MPEPSSLLLFAAVASLVLAVGGALAPSQARTRLARLGARSRGPGGAEAGVLADREGVWERLLGRLAGRVGRDRSAVPGSLRARLLHAGLRRPGAAVLYTGARMLTTVAGAALGWVGGASLEPGERLVAILAGTAIGYLLPSMWLDLRVRRRQGQIEEGLPDALDLMVVCVEAGMGLSASLARVATEFAPTYPVLHEEFELVSLETRTGKSTTDALQGLAERTGLREVSVLVSMLVQSERFGTNVGDSLRVHTDAMRVRRMQRAEERASRAPLKMIFPTALILIGMITIAAGPSFREMLGMMQGN